MRSRDDAQRGAEKASSRSHPPLSKRAGRAWQGTRTGIQLCSKQRLSCQWQRSKSGQSETVLGRNAGRQEQRHQEGRLHRSGASELALDVVRCCSITHRVPALSELRLRAPPRYATRWSTHEGFPVQYTRADDIQQEDNAKRKVRNRPPSGSNIRDQYQRFSVAMLAQAVCLTVLRHLAGTSSLGSPTTLGAASCSSSMRKSVKNLSSEAKPSNA